MTQQETIDALIAYIDEAVARSSVSNRQVAAVLDFLNQRQKELGGDFLPIAFVKGEGSESLPVYFDEEGRAHPITSLLTDGIVTGMQGVSAGGITDVSHGSGSGLNVGVTAYDDLDETEEENLQTVASSYAVARLKADIGVSKLEPFSENRSYRRGDTCSYMGYPFRFTEDKAKGPWILAYCEQVTYSQLLNPTSLNRSDIDRITNA